mmetsp:Transcript_95818/g.241416  ORF Transcript_95818/g.241416 Transcript_95818/m.241416 type:complete len:97 (-) Transcript_95818:128-418(-)
MEDPPDRIASHMPSSYARSESFELKLLAGPHCNAGLDTCGAHIQSEEFHNEDEQSHNTFDVDALALAVGDMLNEKMATLRSDLLASFHCTDPKSKA